MKGMRIGCVLSLLVSLAAFEVRADHLADRVIRKAQRLAYELERGAPYLSRQQLLEIERLVDDAVQVSEGGGPGFFPCEGSIQIEVNTVWRGQLNIRRVGPDRFQGNIYFPGHSNDPVEGSCRDGRIDFTRRNSQLVQTYTGSYNLERRGVVFQGTVYNNGQFSGSWVARK